jgi:hypothetical protein
MILRSLPRRDFIEELISFKLQAFITLLVRLISYNNQSFSMLSWVSAKKKIKKSPRVVDPGDFVELFMRL